MVLKAGQIVAELSGRDGRRVMIRAPQRNDLDDFFVFINRLVAEDAPILMDRPLTCQEEADWLAGKLTALELAELIMLVAEVEGHVVANAEIRRHRFRERHVGTVAISVSKEHRNLGIGTMLIRALIDEARRQALRLLLLEVLKSNVEAIRLYQKVGFVNVGIIPKKVFYRDTYVDSVMMAKEL